ncbi:MAG: flagellar protein FlaG [Planctomycetes bacterium]|nr:flagellar protein FlaG [Planctomycetota bacterium]
MDIAKVTSPTQYEAPQPSLEAPPPEQPAQESTPDYEVDLSFDSDELTSSYQNRSIEFEYVKDLGRIAISVSDKETGEVIRQIPNPEALDFAVNFQRVVGTIFDKLA